MESRQGPDAARLEAERDEARAALSESLAREARYRAVLEHPFDLVVVLEAVRTPSGVIADWRYWDANGKALELLGRTRETLIGARLSEVLPDRAERLIALCARVLADGLPYRYEATVGERTYAVCLFPAGPDAVVSASVDITARKRDETSAQQQSDATRSEKEWLAAVLDSMNDEVYFTDTHRHYTYANPAALREFGHERVAGIPLAEIVGKLEVFRADGTPRPMDEAPPLRALAGEVVRDEEQIVRIPRTGELRHRQVSSAPVRDATGAIIGSVSVARDVTDLKRINAELQSADRRKDEFLAMLAHELRNPLVPIRAGIEMLKRAGERPDLLEHIRPMMERQLGHMVRLIDDLLDISRITSGKIALERRPAPIERLIANAVEANREAIAAGQLDLSIDLAEPDRIIDVDPTRFTQVVANLVQNAVKFTPAGGRLAIAAHVEGEPPVLVLRVADTGAGISATLLPHVFDLFAQDAVLSQGDRTGLGIGLALARQLVVLHGGTIEAHSDGPGLGSTFTIRLPVAPSVRLPETPPPDRLAALDGLRILVIDDNQDSADAMALLLRILGGDVRAAYDGVSGLAVLAEFQPTAVLLDISMPGMDGYAVCRQIRQQHGSNIAVIALSGWGQDRDKQLAREAGFDLHLTKPADPGALAGSILALCARPTPRHPLR